MNKSLRSSQLTSVLGADRSLQKMEGIPRVGRKPKKDVSEQIELYKTYKDDLIENGYIKTATRSIYTILSEKLDNMSAKAINISIVRNSEAIFGKKYTNRKFEKIISEDDEVNVDIWSDDSLVTIKLSDAEQKQFQSYEKKYSDRNRHVLENEWANNLSAIIVRETNINCCINFVRGEIVRNELEANGYCPECKGTIQVKSFDNRRVIQVKVTEGPEKHTFTKKRRLTHDRKKFFQEKLKTSYPSNVLNDLANEMPLLEHESRDIPSESSLKLLRHKVQNELMLDPNCINALRKMKYLPQFEGAIKEIGTDPLRVMFWTHYQELWYKNYAQNEMPTLSIDATGGLVSSTNLLSGLGLDNIKLPHIFLYLLVAKTAEGKSVPVGQFLSADQRSLTISYFLQSWLLVFKKPPKEIVIDDSAALLKSCVMSFTTFASVHEYVQHCFMVMNGIKSALPSSFIRLDVAHFIRNLQNLALFKTADHRVSKFYLCCIGVIISCESFDDIRNIVRNMLIVANNPNEGTLLNGNLLPTQESRNKLNKLVRTHDLSFVAITNDQIMDSDASSNIEEYESTPNWIDEIIDEVNVVEKDFDLDASNSAENMYYLPALNEVLKKLCGRLPLWSAVMKNHFKSANTLASSSNVESTFNRIKNIMMQDIRLPVRIDLFMQKYLTSINGSTKLAISKYPNKKEFTTEETHNQVRRFIVFHQYTQTLMQKNISVASFT